MAQLKLSTAVRLTCLLLLPLCIRQSSAGVPLSDFMPYGVANVGDVSMVSGERRDGTTDDGSSEMLKLQIAFPFFNSLYDSLWVNINGVISFRTVIDKFTPLCGRLSRDYSMIAPFWADIDLSNGGDVLHRESFEPAVLRKATAEVTAAFPELSAIELKWALIATWSNVSFFGCCRNGCRLRNSFQVVLTTDGIRSFAILNYHNISWTTGASRTSGGDCDTGLGDAPAKAGFDAGDGQSFYTISGSCGPHISTVDDRSNVGIAGKWIFRVDSTDIQSAGCNSDSSFTAPIRLVPSFVGMYGHVPIKVMGPCFNDTARLSCRFYDPVKGMIMVGGEAVGAEGSSSRSVQCMAPFFYGGGRIRVDLLLEDAQTLSEWSTFLYVLPPNLATSERLNVSERKMTDDSLELEFKWNVQDFERSSSLLDLNLLELTAKQPEWTMMATLVAGVPNSGHLIVNIGDRDDLHFSSSPLSVYLFALEPSFKGRSLPKPKRELLGNQATESLITEGKVLTKYAKSKWAEELCREWYTADRDSFSLAEFSALPPCPPTVSQYRADSARWKADATCPQVKPDNPAPSSKACPFHPGADFCIRSRNPTASGAGQQCCYRDDLLYTDFRGGGTVDRYHSDSNYYFGYLLHLMYDVRPWLYCCHNEPDELCALYKERRYTDTGINYRSPRAAGGRGDPHITTFDGLGYTFNGAGEFWMLQSGNSSSGMAVQARMEPFGEKSATIFTAFVLQCSDSSRVQIEKVPIRMVDVLVDQVPMDLTSKNPLLLDVAFKNVQVTVQEDLSAVSIAFACGFTFQVDVSSEALSIFSTAEDRHFSQTRGLLGKYDNNEGNDLTDPDGRIISVNSSLEVIHYDFGLKWLVKSSESLFNYANGRSYEYFYKPQFVPNFNQPNILAASPKAREICNQSTECLYDFFTTDSMAIANQTKSSFKQFIDTVEVFKREVLTCSPLKNPQNGIFRVDNFMPGSVATFSCFSGHILKGNETIICTDEGIWAGSEPVCLNGTIRFQMNYFILIILLLINVLI